MRILCICALALMLLASPALAEIIIDPATATLEELTAARDLIDAEIRAREAIGFASGSYEVGTNLPAGQYVIYSDEGTRVSSISIHELQGDEPVLTNFEVVRTQLVVELYEGEQVDLANARAVALSTTEAIDLSSEICNGGYIVGVHLPAGSYSLTPTADALISSYSVQTGPTGAQTSILAFAVIHEPAEITLENGNYLQLTNCILTPNF